MKDIKTAEEVFKEWVKDKPIGAITPTFDGSYLMDRDNAIIFAKQYAEYLLKATVEGIDKDELISSIRTAPSRKDADAYFNWWLENKLLNDL